MPYYLSHQYSAIQAAVLRHDRLWSMAGMSLILARLNEIEFRRIVERAGRGGTTIVAGGGKFTARFDDRESAESARNEMVKLLAERLPMMEFQVSPEIVEGKDLKAIKEELLDPLRSQKQKLRGYAVSFNPHLARCPECGEYPADTACAVGSGQGRECLCSVCASTRAAAYSVRSESLLGSEEASLTTIERILRRYCAEFKDRQRVPAMPFDFAGLFAGPAGDNGRGRMSQAGEEEVLRKRLAVWFSDINHMGNKVPVWLSQDEDRILRTFERITGLFTEIAVRTLCRTFPPDEIARSGREFLPFRLIVAGGDDIWIAMDEAYGLKFAINYAEAVEECAAEAEKDKDHPLSSAWLNAHAATEGAFRAPGGFGKYCFGAGLVFTSSHTSFRAVHHLAEELMKAAKEKTGRQDNAVNWRVMAEDQSLTESAICFHKPLFILDGPGMGPSLKDYIDVCRGMEMSGSHRQQVAGLLLAHAGDPIGFEKALTRLAATGLAKKDFDMLLVNQFFRQDGERDNCLDLGRIATALELLGLKMPSGQQQAGKG